MKRKSSRSGTPYKHNESTLKGMGHSNQRSRASAKPSFDMTISENSSIPEEEVEDKTGSKDKSVSKGPSVGQSPAKSTKVSKQKLAFNPDKVKSRLFESTSSSKSKKRKTVSTPSVTRKKPDAKRSPAVKRPQSAMRRPKDWSAVKSKINTGRTKKAGAAKDVAQKAASERKKVLPLKRRLSWSASKSAKESGSKNDGPATKKRRISAHPATATKNQIKERKWQ